MRRIIIGLLMWAVPIAGGAAEVRVTEDKETGWKVYEQTEKDIAIKVCPDAGCNLFSIKYRGREILKTPGTLKELPGFMFGVPVLYPTPNRVRDSKLLYDGQTYTFPPNNGPNFLHGLVHNAPWQASTGAGADGAVAAELDFAPGKPWFERFPFPHTLRLETSVKPDAVRWTYTVDNRQGTKPVPFGFGLHPWFLYQGSRPSTFVTIPAAHVMEARELLPTGKLLPLAGSKFDARRPITLAGFVIDDVYEGMRPAAPPVIDFREEHLRISLAASEDFTHLVVYTPANQPWFCVENQTCSTDAHNLFTKGLENESHLLVVPAGKAHSGWVEYRIEHYE